MHHHLRPTAARARATLGVAVSFLFATMSAACDERGPLEEPATTPDAGAPGTRGETKLMAPRAWAREGRWLFQELDAQPIGMSRDGGRILEANGALWSDDGGATTTVVHAVDDPVALSGDGGAVIGRLGGGAPCATLARWTAAGLEPVAPRGAPGVVSAEGGVVVGTAAFGCDPITAERAFVWNGNGAMVIEPLSSDDDQTEGFALSGDGATLIGFSSSASSTTGRLFYWRAATGTFPLEESRIWRPGHGVFVSDDGEVVAGTVEDDAGVSSAFLWTASAGAGLEVLPGLASRLDTYVVALSADGAVVLALGTDGDNGIPFTWSRADGAQLLEPSDGPSQFQALAMSADASLIVGQPSGVDTAPVAWDTQRAPSVLFGDAPTFGQACRPHVTHVSADAKTLAGTCNAHDGRTAFVARPL